MSISLIEWVLGFMLIASSLGIIFLKKPVHACLSFLVTLMSLATIYLMLSAQFIAVMQILVYVGAILVIFMFVIILFQDAHQQIEKYQQNSSSPLLYIAGTLFLFGIILLGYEFSGIQEHRQEISQEFGSVQALGRALYIDYFFPFEAIILLFLVAIVGAVYVGRKGNAE